MDKMKKIDWLILDVLSDDWETMTQIYPMVLHEASAVSREEIIDRIEALYQKDFVQIQKDVVFDKQKILSELPEDYYTTNFWFGLTEKGVVEWEENSERFGGFKVDWSENWTANYDYIKEEGWIYGVNESICIRQLGAKKT